MVDPLEGWEAKLLEMSPVGTFPLGALNLANFYGDMADKVNAVDGTQGIFIFNRALFASTWIPVPVGDSSWVPILSAAWNTAVAASVIAPGTVTDPSWTASGSKDTMTLPLGISTILNLATAETVLQAGLAEAIQDKTDKFAKAFRDATLAFQFTCIGLTPPAVPLPLVKGAQ